MPVLAEIWGTALWAIDITLIAAGGIILSAWSINWWRQGHRDPLRGSPIRLNRLTPVWLWLCFVGQLLCWIIGQKLVSIAGPGGPQAKVSSQALVLGGNIAQALMLVFCLFVAKTTFVTGRTGLGIGRRPFTRDLLPAVGGWLAANAICWVLARLSLAIWMLFYPNTVPPEHTVITVLAASETSVIVRVVVIVGAIILAPVGEELLFRGILQSGIKKLMIVRWGSWQHRWIAIAVTATIFGLVHTGTPHHIPSLIALGAILGYLYERSGSLVLPILVHMLFNGKTLLWMAIT